MNSTDDEIDHGRRRLAIVPSWMPSPQEFEFVVKLDGPCNVLHWNEETHALDGVLSVWFENGNVTKMREQSLMNLRAGVP